jgi:hypothetical protein
MDIEERKQFYLSHFENQKSSGLCVKDYCKANGISDCSFYSWRKRLRREETHSSSVPAKQTQPSPIHFTPLSLSSIQPSSSSPYIIEFSSGTRVSINSLLNSHELSYLLTSLKD